MSEPKPSTGPEARAEEPSITSTSPDATVETPGTSKRPGRGGQKGRVPQSPTDRDQLQSEPRKKSGRRASNDETREEVESLLAAAAARKSRGGQISHHDSPEIIAMRQFDAIMTQVPAAAARLRDEDPTLTDQQIAKKLSGELDWPQPLQKPTERVINNRVDMILQKMDRATRAASIAAIPAAVERIRTENPTISEDELIKKLLTELRWPDRITSNPEGSGMKDLIKSIRAAAIPKGEQKGSGVEE